MSFLTNARGEFNPAKVNDGWKPSLELEFPTIAEALAGSAPDVKASDRIPPMTLMIFDKEGKLRFSFSSRDYPRAFYGCVGDPQHVLESIEDALVNDQGEWVTKRDAKR